MSLVQARMAIDRARLLALTITIIAGVSLALNIFSIVTGANVHTWAGAVAALLFTATGIYRLRKARRLQLEFDRIHGPDAGRRERVR